MELTLDRYLNDDALRAALERRAHRERAEAMQRQFALAAALLHLESAPAPRTGACA